MCLHTSTVLGKGILIGFSVSDVLVLNQAQKMSEILVTLQRTCWRRRHHCRHMFIQLLSLSGGKRGFTFDNAGSELQGLVDTII